MQAPLNRNEMKKAAICLAALAVILGGAYAVSRAVASPESGPSIALTAAAVKSQAPETLEEADSYGHSADRNFWLDSGAEAEIAVSDAGWPAGTSSVKTIAGSLAAGSPWQTEYAETNPTDTDSGLHPQNLFRLFTDAEFSDASYSAYATIRKIILSPSPNRNESNGALLMFRVQDSDNLYYAGLRVDGSAVIKKKVGGTYYTLATIPVFAYAKYDATATPNLLPLDIPLGMKVETKNVASSSVDISFSIDIGHSGNWVRILHAVDSPTKSAPSLPFPGHAGIRSDFMEMEISDFKITNQ